MARVIALTHARIQLAHTEILRSGIVCSCALALIAAGNALPY